MKSLPDFRIAVRGTQVREIQNRDLVMSRSTRKQQIRSLMLATGKRPRGAANILNRAEHLASECGEPQAKATTAASSLNIRHVYLAHDTRWEIEVFALNQTISTYSTKLKGWLSPQHRLDPHYARADWTEEHGTGYESPRRASEGQLRAVAAAAMSEVEPFGYLLVVHAPGLMSLMWSDHPLPRIVSERIPESMFGPAMKAAPRQPIVDGPPPSWWPDAEPRKDSLVRVRDEDDPEREMRLFAECSRCHVVSKTNGFDAVPALLEINNGTAIKRAIERRLDPSSREQDRGPHVAIIEVLVQLWRDELRRQGCVHI
jgi:hypothetical protein